MKLHTIFSSAFKGLIVLSVVFFLSAAGFQDKLTSGWYQQYFPNLNGSTIKDMTFLDSLTGFAVTSPDAVDNGYILKTSNGGDNWFIVQTYPPPNGNIGFTRIMFANNNTGYASTDYFDLFKTINGGLNWVMYSNQNNGANDFYVINSDTLLYVSSSGFGGGVYRSTNGGLNWSMIWTSSNPNRNPAKIYMFDKNLGFIQDLNVSASMLRTTNGGSNWNFVSGEYFSSIKFLDSNTGWKVYDSIKKTTNGGLNWYAQKTPNISQVFTLSTSISIINKDTIWIGGAYYNFIGLIYKTTNGGVNWGYQIPDSTLTVYSYGFIQFINNKVGWIRPVSPSLVLHTEVGGNDTTYITEINRNSGEVVSNYQLFQNYPNPFNPSTTISYKLAKSGNVRIKVLDIAGKEIEELVNKKLQAGSYKITFNSTKYSSGIYFYSMIIDEKVVDTKKMIYLK